MERFGRGAISCRSRSYLRQAAAHAAPGRSGRLRGRRKLGACGGRGCFVTAATAATAAAASRRSSAAAIRASAAVVIRATARGNSGYQPSVGVHHGVLGGCRVLPLRCQHLSHGLPGQQPGLRDDQALTIAAANSGMRRKQGAPPSDGAPQRRSRLAAGQVQGYREILPQRDTARPAELPQRTIGAADTLFPLSWWGPRGCARPAEDQEQLSPIGDSTRVSFVSVSPRATVAVGDTSISSFSIASPLGDGSPAAEHRQSGSRTVLIAAGDSLSAPGCRLRRGLAPRLGR
jgi:hypothetical protein